RADGAAASQQASAANILRSIEPTLAAGNLADNGLNAAIRPVKMVPQHPRLVTSRSWGRLPMSEKIARQRPRDADDTPVDVSRRSFLTKGAAAGVGAAALTGTSAGEVSVQPPRWDYAADVVVVGAGVAGLPAAIAARDAGASVIVVDENFDIGGR